MDPITTLKNAARGCFAAAALAGLSATTAQADLGLTEIGRYTIGVSTAAEISAFDAGSARLFVLNLPAKQIDIVDLSDPTTPEQLGAMVCIFNNEIYLANSLTARNGVVMVAAEAPVKTNPGRVFFFSYTGNLLTSVAAGALPDMLTLTPDGTKVLVANEGEPNSYNQGDSVDPEGSVTIIDVSFPGVGQVTVGNVSTATFTSFNGQEAALRAEGVRIYGPNATAAQDLEPEYIAVSPDSTTAYVSMQEANACAVINIATATVTDIRSWGLKDYSAPGNGIDPSDRDNGSNGPAINIHNVPVFGMYQPDSTVSFQIGDTTYLLTANEGDAREWTGYAEEARVGSGGYVLDATVFPNGAALKNNAELGRLSVTTATGSTDGDAEFEQIHSLGARSFSIWNASTGAQVWDSGDDLEQFTAETNPATFNSDGTTASFDTRSDNKGPEPEAATVGEAYGRTFAFVGMERTGGILMYDISVPTAPVRLDYKNPAADRSPEGVIYIKPSDSPTGEPLVVVSHEVSGTATIYAVRYQDRSYQISEGATLTVAAAEGLLADYEGEVEDVRIRILEAPQGGLLNVTPNGAFTFEPELGFAGTTSFQYALQIDGQETAPITVTLTVNGAFGLRRTTYTGLILPEVPELANAGRIQATVTGSSVSGKLLYGGATYSFLTTLTNNATPVVTIDRRAPLSDITVQLQGVLVDGLDQLNVTVVDGDPINAVAEPPVVVPRGSVVAEAGTYTGAFTPAEEVAAFGWVTGSIGTTGLVKFVGSLADGTPFSASTALTRQKHMPIFAMLYRNRGYLATNPGFNNSTFTDAEGQSQWVRPENAGPRFGAFEVTPTFLVAKYTKPAVGQRVLPWLNIVNNGLLVAQGLNPAVLAQAQITLLTTNKVVVAALAAGNPTVAINTKNGAISGTITANNVKYKYAGVVLQKASVGFGYFLTAGSTGLVQLLPSGEITPLPPF